MTFTYEPIYSLVVLECGPKVSYDTLLSGFLDRVQPRNALELFLVWRLADAALRIGRAQLFGIPLEAPEMTQLRRTYDRAAAELMRLRQHKKIAKRT